MPAQFIADSTKGPGFGIITISDVHCTTAPTFALYRASDNQSLSTHGWQTAETYLHPDNWDCDSGALRMSVGHDVVNFLDPLETYRIFISIDGENLKPQTLSIENIEYTSMHGGQGLGNIQPTAPIAAAVVPPPSNAPEPTDEPSLDSQIMEEPIVESLQDDPVQTEPLTMDQDAQESQKQRSSTVSPLLIIAIICLLAAVGAGIWWYLTQKDALPTTQQEQSENTQEAQTPEETKPTDEAPAQPKDAQEQNTKPTETTPPVQSSMEKARELLRKNASGNESFTLAQSLQAATENTHENVEQKQDALFLLLEDAAQKGVAQAMLDLGAYYDPSDTKPKGSISPDAIEALTWYQKAHESGQQDAAAAIERLRTYAEDAAAKGDALAKEVLNKLAQ